MTAGSQGAGRAAERPRVVLLTRWFDAVPSERPWTGADTLEVVLWAGEAPGRRTRWWARGGLVGGAGARPQSGTASGASTARGALLRTAGARAKSSVAARRRGVDPGWLWALKSDRALAGDVRGSELLLVLDAETGAALQAAPDLARGVPVLGADLGPAVLATLEHWEQAVSDLEAALGADADDVFPVLETLAETVGTMVAVPELLSRDLVARTEVVTRKVPTLLPAGISAAVVETVLVPLVNRAAPQVADLFASPAASAALVSGSRVPDEAELEHAVRASFRAADEAADIGARHRAVARAHDGLSLLLHRSRHAALDGSPIAGDAASFLEPFTTSRVAGVLRGAGPVGGPAAAESEPTSDGRPRVLILPGSYGAFHQDMVDSLGSTAEVSAPDLPRQVQLLRQRRPSPDDLELLTGLRRGHIDIAEGLWRNDPVRTRRLRTGLRGLQTLWQLMSAADVVVSDWVDAGAMWASQVRPPGVRLVLRAHSLDLLDPWLHLVDWRTVDEVMVSNDGMMSIYRELTAGTGAPEGMTVRPHRPDLPDWHRPRDPSTRFTIGMVGWGRAPKDPAWALDLLERDERRRLVLIGAPPGVEPYAATRTYFEQVLARMEQPHLRERITVVGPTSDVAGELAQVGIILSSSIREGWHLGLIEGAASGAVPVVRDWPLVARRGGARSLFPAEWVVADLDEADARLTALADPEHWQAAADRARREVLELFAAEPAAQTYRDAILGTVGR
ncbi:hypothetical protein [Ornithinimicrobium cryptoxanthini]|uniref:Glycosyltransferase involved in cell wall biosynthesis n=1 Tax=Ornithinimicrobium cryptoxanthini TaxID=2934161 RepID=A0ABY4YI92_9MICO|nr:hypothetical protein [Ornithinimicrobium cryptoxanthini]USQ76324.1 hypothetical protein NF557_17335 [Ornithinimicrobium cryptoxanthini]